MKPRRIPLNVNLYGRAEEQAFLKVWRSGRLTQGPKVAKFEAEFGKWLGLPPERSTLFVNSGSSANWLAAQLLAKMHREVRQGKNEVIMPALTWSTSVAPVIQSGLKPVFVDVGPDLTIDPGQVQAAIGEKTIGILAVHLLGNPCMMVGLQKLAREQDLYLAEDCCEALGAELNGRRVGTWGHAATFSYYFSHHLSTLEGGMLVYPKKYHEVTAWREHGWIRDYPETEKTRLLGMYPDFDPRWVFDELGWNLRSTDLNAALGLVQLGKVAAQRNTRQAIAVWYAVHLRHDLLENPMTHLTSASGPNPFSYPILVGGGLRSRLAKHLESKGIETRPIMTGDIVQHPWYTRNPDAYRAMHRPRTQQAHTDGLLLPLHPKLGDEELVYIRDAVLGFLDGAAKAS